MVDTFKQYLIEVGREEHPDSFYEKPEEWVPTHELFFAETDDRDRPVSEVKKEKVMLMPDGGGWTSEDDSGPTWYKIRNAYRPSSYNWDYRKSKDGELTPHGENYKVIKVKELGDQHEI
jgi:hypothetical protein